MLRFLRFFFLLLVLLAFAAFAIVNRGSVGLSFFPLPYSVEMPIFLLAILCFALGAIVAGLVMAARMARLRIRFIAEHRRADALENELKGLRMESPLAERDPVLPASPGRRMTR